jgi:hypothetical protein
MIGSDVGLGGRSMAPGSAALRLNASAGRVSVPKSIARICITVNGTGIAPAPRANSTKGATSAIGTSAAPADEAAAAHDRTSQC